MTLRRIASLIRKAIIVVLTLAAVGTGYLWVESHIRTYTVAAEPLPSRASSFTEHGREIHLWSWSGSPPAHDRNSDSVFAALNASDYAAWLVFYRGSISCEVYNSLPWTVNREADHWSLTPPDHWFLPSTMTPAPTVRRIGPFSYRKGMGRSYPGPVCTTVKAPFWAAIMGILAYPAIAFIRGPLRRHRRRKRGLCLHCGYDLRGTTGGVCSECGEEVGTL